MRKPRGLFCPRKNDLATTTARSSQAFRHMRGAWRIHRDIHMKTAGHQSATSVGALRVFAIVFQRREVNTSNRHLSVERRLGPRRAFQSQVENPPGAFEARCKSELGRVDYLIA